jgi:hypothetical protein
VLVAMDKFATRPLRPPAVMRRTSDTAAQRRAHVLRGLAAWLKPHLRDLPADVQRILEAAPIPQSATVAPPDTPEQRGGFTSEAAAVAASNIPHVGAPGSVHHG